MKKTLSLVLALSASSAFGWSGRKPARVELGLLEHPAQALGGKAFRLKARDALYFSLREIPAKGLGEIKMTPNERPNKLIAGQNYSHEPGEPYAPETSRPVGYAFIVPPEAAPGTVFDVQIKSHTLPESDPDAAFSFKIEVLPPAK